ncbi:MAG: nucleoside 2-deoxyribosyltransferase [Acidobacteriota bacterium]|nr:nucleoside 2-deoxyribosyltransferase [Acidobacteriota bacterium]
MGRCFVIQPFDKGAYDKRYEDVLVPAITGAGLVDYRVDRDPATKVLIEAIEEGIRSSDACVAEISSDNPNVWYELGFAIANGKPIVMICNSKERNSAFPFDVRHRAIIPYATDSPRDFHALQSEVTKRLKALLEAVRRAQTMASIESSETISGLSPHEMAAIQIVMGNQLSAHDSMSASFVRDEMVKAGFSKLAATLSLQLLRNRGFMEEVADGNINETWWCYRVTQSGIDWLISNQNLLQLRQPPKVAKMVDEDFGGTNISDDYVSF